MRTLLTLILLLTLGVSLLPVARAGIDPRLKADLRRVAVIISEGRSAGEYQDVYSSTLLSLARAELDPDRALAFAAGSANTAPDEVLANTIILLAAIDPALAAQWAPQRLSRIADMWLRIDTMLALGTAIVHRTPDMAAELYRLVKEQLSKLTPEQQAMYHARLALLGARLHDDAATGYLYKAISQANDPKKSPDMLREIITLFLPYNTDLTAELNYCGTAANEQFARILCVLAQGQAAEAARLADALPERTQRHVYLECIRVAANTDPPLAYRLLAVLKADKPVASFTDPALYPQAVQYIILGDGRRHPAKALALAYTVRDQMTRLHILVLAARYQPKQTALRVLQEAARHFNTKNWVGIAELAYTARAAYAFDPKIAGAIFAPVVTNSATREDTSELTRVAFYGAQVDPKYCRSLVETRLSHQQDYWNSIELIQIMTAVNIDHAREMIKALPDTAQRHEARLRLVGYLLVPPDVRRTLSYTWWDQLGFRNWNGNSRGDPGFTTLTARPMSW